jgi:hypothetical protein
MNQAPSEGKVMGTGLADVQFRAYRKGDEEGINRAYAEVFERRSLEEWRWKFQGNPEGFSLITVAEADGKIVGQYANLVVRLQVGERIVLACQGLDNFVHKDYRRLGSVQLKLASAQPSIMREAGVALAFGFPNEQAYLLGKYFLGYQDLFSFPIHFRRLTWRLAVQRRFPRLPGWILGGLSRLSAAVTRCALRRHRNARISVHEVADFDRRVDALWEAARTSYSILTVRTQPYLTWRYVARPQHRYAILVAERDGALVGYVVLKREADGDVGQIVDFLSVPDEAVDRALVSAALQWCLDQGFAYVLCGMLEEDRVYRSLVRCGFRRHRDFSPLRISFGVSCTELDPAVVRDPDDWHITLGDSDHV